MTSRFPAARSDPWPWKAFQISYPVAGAIADWRALQSPLSQSNTLLLPFSAFRPILRMIGYSALQKVRYTIIGHIVIIWELSKLGTPAPLLSFLQPRPSNLSGPISLLFHSNPANQICPALYSRDLNPRSTRYFNYAPVLVDLDRYFDRYFNTLSLLHFLETVSRAQFDKLYAPLCFTEEDYTILSSDEPSPVSSTPFGVIRNRPPNRNKNLGFEPQLSRIHSLASLTIPAAAKPHVVPYGNCNNHRLD